MYPHFLCIGAQKAGTTWLQRNAEQHPELWLPPLKELHYFGEPSPRPLALRLAGSKREDTRWRRVAWRRLRALRHVRQDQHLLWYARFFLLPRSDEWYASLFQPRKGQIPGEISPEFARLDEATVAHIHALMPDAKIVYLLRNPIQRLWSQAAMHFRKPGRPGIEKAPPERIREFLDRDNSARHSDYARTLDLWGRHYPSERIFVGFFDQLTADPAGLLRDVYRFLGVDASDRYVPENVREKRNSRPYPKIPDEFARHLAGRYLDQIERAHERLQSPYTADWLDYARRHLTGPA